ncbi:MAG: TolC family protein [Armatimonadetes bacterium]|nr:TolC family protein [Armatimonadota bacterium]
MRHCSRLALAAMLALSTGCSLSAQTDLPAKEIRPLLNGPVTLSEAVETALQMSPLVRGSAADVEAAQARLRAARAQTRPWASITALSSGGSMGSIVSTPMSVQPSMAMSVPDGRFSAGNLMVMYPLLTGGRLSAGTRSAIAQSAAASQDLETRQQDVVLTARNAYHEVIARKSLVEVAQARLREDEERLRLDRVRLQQEQIPSYYIQRGEAEVASTQQALTNAKRDVELALIALKTVIGLDPASKIDVQGALDFTPSDEIIRRIIAPSAAAGSDERLQALLATARSHRPEIEAAEQREAASRALIQAARGEFSPQVNLFGSGDIMDRPSMDSRGGVTFGIVASVPLYNGGERSAQVAETKAEHRKQREQQAQVELQIAQEVQSALVSLLAAEQNVTTAQKAVDAAKAEYEAAQKRYEVGRSVVVEVLDSVTAKVRAETNVVQALYEYNLAQDALRRATGVIETSESEESLASTEPSPAAASAAKREQPAE